MRREGDCPAKYDKCDSWPRAGHAVKEDLHNARSCSVKEDLLCHALQETHRKAREMIENDHSESS